MCGDDDEIDVGHEDCDICERARLREKLEAMTLRVLAPHGADAPEELVVAWDDGPELVFKRDESQTYTIVEVRRPARS